MCFFNLSKFIVVIFVSFTQMASQVAYPQLPSLVQGALNSTNVCYEACGEVELLATIANRANEILKVGGTPDYVNIASMAAAGPIANYSHVLAKFVQSHAGGPPFSCIDYLTSFVHQDKSVALGKEFMQSVVETAFSNTNMFPLCRVGFLACNLTCPKSKIQDGFSRLLTRTDIVACKAKKYAPVLHEMENNMAEAWTKVLATENSSHAYKCFGRLQVRSILHLLKKEKHGQEEKVFESLAAILRIFENEIKAEPVPPSSAAMGGAAASSSGDGLQSIKLEDAKNPMFLAEMKVDLKLGATLAHKEYPGKVFKLESKTQDSITLLYVDPLLPANSINVTVGALEILNVIKNTKSKAMQLMDPAILENAFANIVCAQELAKAEAYCCLMECYNAHDCDSSYISILGDRKLHAACPLKKGDLCFIPITTAASQLLSDQPKGEHGAYIQCPSGAKFFVAAPKLFNAQKPADGGIIAPYFLCKHNAEHGQMQHSVIEFKNYKFQCLKNTSALAKGDEIQCSTFAFADGSSSLKKRKLTGK